MPPLPSPPKSSDPLIVSLNDFLSVTETMVANWWHLCGSRLFVLVKNSERFTITPQESLLTILFFLRHNSASLEKSSLDLSLLTYTRSSIFPLFFVVLYLEHLLALILPESISVPIAEYHRLDNLQAIESYLVHSSEGGKDQCPLLASYCIIILWKKSHCKIEKLC